MSRKLTHDEQVAAIAKVNPNVEVLEEITGNAIKVLCRCKVCQHEWDARPADLKSGKGCPECKKIKVANTNRLTHTEHVAIIAEKNPAVEVLGEIINDRTKVLCRCKVCGYKWETTPNKLKQGRNCLKCSRIKHANKLRLTHAEQVAAIAKAKPDVEVLGEIKGDLIKVLCRCLVCGHEWGVQPRQLKRGKGCPACAGKKLTHTDHVATISKVNPDVEVLGEIINVRTKVLCRCKVCCHEWEAKPSELKKGYGCPRCKKVKMANARRLPHAEHVAAINKVNHNIEILEEITNINKKVKCRCAICRHEWGARPAELKRGHGCPKCAKTGFLTHDVGKLYIMVDDLELPTMIKIGVSVREDRSKQVLQSARRAGVFIPALHVAKTWEGPTDLMQRIEQMMHDNYKEWNIKFPAKFDGCTEFFYYTPETAEAFDIIEATYHEIINANQAA